MKFSEERIARLKNLIGKQDIESPSPFGNLFKGKVLAVEGGRLEGEYFVRKELTNPAGMLHGGAICTMLDEVMGLTIYTLDVQNFYPTVNLNVDFLSSAAEGEAVIVKTQVIRQGKNIIHIEGRLYNTDGKILAKATSNYAKIDHPIQ
ncbi:PaaI family thioesterase [Persicobacter psychrovividus]|uniref:Thioesterase domain-containing protein n=1 Tax=Persicobacter psychrovividus TaxID=387638 RepID=A0ABM7VIS0_9BACT|nr:hypothetical protein PEPS_31650 [Persicobacter psychrovividus]